MPDPRRHRWRAWGITQFRLGGVALLPTGALGSPDRVSGRPKSRRLAIHQPGRSPSLLARSGPQSSRPLAGPRFKIGSGPSPGRLGYLIDRQLFTKEIPPAGAGTYPDRGAVAQVFVDDSFCELESVGPIVALEPGSSGIPPRSLGSHASAPIWPPPTTASLDEAGR